MAHNLLNQWFFISILVILKALSTSSVCYLQDHQIRDEWRLILQFQDDELKLLRQRDIADNTTLYFVCGEHEVTEMKCENGHLNGEMPLPHCYNRPMPVLKAETDADLCPHQLYRVGFNIKCRDQEYFHTTYLVCFDHRQMICKFTINEAYPFVQGRPRDMRFDPDEIFTMNIFAAYNKRSILSRFNGLLGSQQTFMGFDEQVRRFDRGHFTPAGDFMLNTLIRSTFKMINVIPQFHAINDGNWRLMEEWARNPLNTPSKVCSGAFDWVLQLPNSNGDDVEIYFSDRLIPVPLWTYKVVLSRDGVRTVFLQYNNIHDQRVPPQIPGDICRIVACPSSIFLTQSNFLGYTYCCGQEHFMNQVVPNLRGYC
uniref:DNA/RNA non-specific endonuclease/pyrophosphatase/phosphodiesterase domain-containing protein n=1 Tax=Stomoxys calcitrans TaxID=35570 RepID=A0A1I8NVA7_STOCA